MKLVSGRYSVWVGSPKDTQEMDPFSVYLVLFVYSFQGILLGHYSECILRRIDEY